MQFRYKAWGFCVNSGGLLTYEAGAFPWLGTVIGGYLRAGNCSGGWMCHRDLYCAGEGLIGSWIALFTYMVMSAVMCSPHVSGFNQTLQHYRTEHNSIAETFNLSVWPLIAVLLVITFWVVMKELKKPKLKSRDLTAAPNRDRSYSV
ncbi:YeeE/YedE thiosulfate transporter family protein [Shigella flexneri]